MRVFKPNLLARLRGAVVPALFSLCILVFVLFGLRQAERGNRAEGLRILDESIRQAAVRCYALEGSYPNDISYIEEHYGVRIDRTKYAVHYTVLASNIMPDITVVELGEQQ